MSCEILLGCWAITGPDKVDGYVGGSLSVRCHYDEGYEDNAKLWCKKKKHFLRNSCRTSLESETGKKLRKGNLSIKDNKGKLYFEVTMDELRMDDAGLYQCVVDGPLFDMQDVEVVVFPVHFLPTQVSTYNMEDAHKEEPIPDHPPDVDGMGLYRIVAAHPQSNKGIHSQEKASENKDDIPYATLVLPDLQHQAIYDNVALPSHALPQPPNKEVIYTEVAKKPGH
ncbi:CMRF35-like molecule 1 [Elgaria multicarinata webbii]|uniref:CMRF35-like molecule 1 n=1 Tax=Elgaria multicarinata webbii TaxID=159646 RepID=UPI002FCCDB84